MQVYLLRGADFLAVVSAHTPEMANALLIDFMGDRLNLEKPISVEPIGVLNPAYSRVHTYLQTEPTE